MRKFEVGDKVRVAGLMRFSVPSKASFIGKVFTIEKVDGDAEYPAMFPYSFVENDEFMWCDEELALVDPPTVIEGVVEMTYTDGAIVGGTYLHDFLKEGEHVRITIERIRKEGDGSDE